MIGIDIREFFISADQAMKRKLERVKELKMNRKKRKSESAVQSSNSVSTSLSFNSVQSTSSFSSNHIQSNNLNHDSSENEDSSDPIILESIFDPTSLLNPSSTLGLFDPIQKRDMDDTSELKISDLHDIMAALSFDCLTNTSKLLTSKMYQNTLKPCSKYWPVPINRLPHLPKYSDYEIDCRDSIIDQNIQENLIIELMQMVKKLS